MPILTNPRHELFCQELAKGKSALAAHEAAGFKPNAGNAGNLRNKKHIVIRLNEILANRDRIAVKATEKAVEKISIDKAWVMAKLVEHASAAFAKEDFGPANKAVELLGKEIGMFIDRKESGKPGDFERMNDDDLRKFIADRINRDGEGAPGKGTAH